MVLDQAIADAGAVSAVWIEREGERIPLRGKGTTELRRDDLVVVETAGGGGHGTAG